MFTAEPTPTGERVVLRPVSVDDVPALAAMLADPEGRRLTGTHATFTEEQLRAWYATRAGQADRLVLGYAFNLGLHRVELEVYAFNPRAQAVYEKAGFVREGVRRDALRWDGEWVDAVTMAILAPG